MIKNQCGSIIYYYGDTPKLAGIVMQEVDTDLSKYWDRTIVVGSLDMKKLTTIRDYNKPNADDTPGKYQKQDVKCFDDFFVIDSKKRNSAGIEMRFYDKYSYQGELLESKSEAYEKQDPKEVEVENNL